MRAQHDGAEWLRARCALARHVARRHGALLDGDERLAGLAVQHEQHARLRRLQDSRQHLGAPADRRERRRRGVVVVPEIVMHGLEVPGDLAGRGPQCHDRVCVAIVAGTQPAVVVGARARGRRKDEASRRVRDHQRPDIGSAGSLRAAVSPGRECRVTRILGNRVPASSAAGRCVRRKPVSRRWPARRHCCRRSQSR